MYLYIFSVLIGKKRPVDRLITAINLFWTVVSARLNLPYGELLKGKSWKRQIQVLSTCDSMHWRPLFNRYGTDVLVHLKGWIRSVWICRGGSNLKWHLFSFVEPVDVLRNKAFHDSSRWLQDLEVHKERSILKCIHFLLQIYVWWPL